MYIYYIYIYHTVHVYLSHRFSYPYFSFLLHFLDSYMGLGWTVKLMGYYIKILQQSLAFKIFCLNLIHHVWYVSMYPCILRNEFILRMVYCV